MRAFLAVLLLSTAGCSERVVDAQPKHYVGIGAELTMEAAGARVVRILDGSSAREHGLVEGDVLLEVEGRPVRGRTLADVVTDLRGEEGSEVALLVRTRDGNRTVTVERRAIANP
jgi:carboxyl-terminal processing protease